LMSPPFLPPTRPSPSLHLISQDPKASRKMSSSACFNTSPPR
jgi:hypothetical protein